MKRLTDKRFSKKGFTVVSLEEYKDIFRRKQPSVNNLYTRLAKIENILGDDYDLDRIKELVDADREERCVILPCKIGQKVYWINQGKLYETNFSLADMCGAFGQTVFLTPEEAVAKLKEGK